MEADSPPGYCFPLYKVIEEIRELLENRGSGSDDSRELEYFPAGPIFQFLAVRFIAGADEALVTLDGFIIPGQRFVKAGKLEPADMEAFLFQV